MKNSNTRQKNMMSAKRERLIFYSLGIALPLLQFFVFYLYVNINSFVLAFEKLDYQNGGYVFAGFENFKQIFLDFKATTYLQSSISNSLILFIWSTIFGSAFAIFFSYYIYKKYPGGGLFKFILYTPHILSETVFVLMFSFFVDNAIPELSKLWFHKEIVPPLASDLGTKMFVVMFFSIWVSFGTKVLMYSGAMSGISESIIEAGKLDGITPLRELISVVIPMIWSTFSTFMVASVIGIFTNQMSLYTFFLDKADYSLYTFGYYLFKSVQTAQISEYPYLSAMGLLLTVIAVPLTLGVKFVFDKLEPKQV